ncbi:MAG TPA: dTDP-glucose 4,6-dehydratase [Candidatus Brocadiia bacterium]|nr:dTDP-glucose 4,6-dehydratase [Planctomycetota bacterium]MDO8094357.1 dTDP-glucose 4,6-dehydratase [Candidatus Brocadiales bacterium]
MSILVTGGAGFIGSHFARMLVNQSASGGQTVVLDKLTYAGNMENLREITDDLHKSGYFKFYKGDICNRELVEHVVKEDAVDTIVNFAADSHVDRSIMDAGAFIDTDMKGVYVLLEVARNQGAKKFIQISTDEVYGAIPEGSFKETDPINPRNPYAASKAGGDRLAYSYWVTYGVPVIITRACNNYGTNQYPEKLVPLFITNAIENKKLPLYGDGMQVRDWLHVKDHCEAIDFLIRHGKNGEVYNISANNEHTNIETTHLILDELKKPHSLIEHVLDREGHDRRYSLDSTKIRQLGWQPKIKYEEGIRSTVRWYLKNEDWWRKIKSGEFLEYYKRQYEHRMVSKSAK